MVAESGAVRVTDLVTRFDVNAATIRRDLNLLEEQGKLRRVHGGALAVEEDHTGSDGASPTTQEARIGQTVAEMIADGETIFLGPGQLTLEAARCLVTHSQLTIVTNGLEIGHWVAKNTSHTLIVTGGQAGGRDLGLTGQLTKSALANLRAAHVIMELDGVSAVDGLTDDDLARAEIAQLLLEVGSEIIILVPAKRMGEVAAAYVAPASDADVIITAREASSPPLWDLSEMGVRIVLA
jgi:DeoR/GlpR family transcriptional regulator of sugar metabolism